MEAGNTDQAGGSMAAWNITLFTTQSSDYRQNSLVRYGFWRQMYSNTNGTVISRVTCRVNNQQSFLMGQVYPLPIQLAIPILVVELNDIAKSQIMVSYTKRGLIRACRS